MKRTLFLLIAFFAFTGFIAVNANAKTTNPKANDNGQIPEVSGDYAVPGRSDLRVRVFVHAKNGAKGGIPGPNPQNSTPTPTPGDVTPTPTSAPTPTPAPVVCSDPASSAVTGTTGWHLPGGSIPFLVNQDSAPSIIGGTTFADVAQAGFNTWSSYISSSSSKPVPQYAGTTTKTRKNLDGENIIAFGKTSGTTIGVTYTWYYTATNEVAETDTILNDRLVWAYGSCSQGIYDLANILVHEEGHWYGLDDEYGSNYVDNTMYGYGDTAEQKKTTPATGDITGLLNIY